MKKFCIILLFLYFGVLTGKREKRVLLHSDGDEQREIVQLRSEVASLKNEIIRTMAGKGYSHSGSGSNSLCLPSDPTWGKYDDTNQGDHGYIYGGEFDEQLGNTVFGKSVRNEDISCAVCKVTGTSVMIPARFNCYPGWKMEYTGYLMSAYHNHYSTNYVCMDGDPDFVYRGSADTNGHTLFLVEGICGTLPCPPYYNYRELACVVCSM